MLIFENVTKRFGEDRVGLEKINFEVKPGEFVFLTGHSGSGKTTMLRLLLKEYLLTDGRIVFEDQNVDRLRGNKVAKHRQKIGVVFQDSKLLPEFTVRENIALPLYFNKHNKKEIAERVADLLELVGLPDFADHFPSQLSGGQAQRIGIARALATAPKLIFADEPTGNLDQKASELIVDLLGKINHYGTTIIFSTHNTVLIDKVPQARLMTLEYGHLINDTGCQIDDLITGQCQASSDEPTSITHTASTSEDKNQDKDQNIDEDKTTNDEEVMEKVDDETKEEPVATKKGKLFKRKKKEK